MSKSVSLKIPKMDKLLNDKNVLYIVFVIAILNVLGYLMTRNIEAVLFLLIIGYLTTYFSKNMIIVLITTIILTSIFASTRTTYVQEYSGKEGMTSSNKKNDSGNTKNKDKAKNEMNTQKQMVSDDDVAEDVDDDADSEEVSGKVSTISNKKGKDNYIDYASTLQKAYANLQTTVGEGGIEGLTNQTSNLLNQQKKLMKNIETMQPFLKTADSFMQNFNMDGLDGITGMLSKLTGKTSK